MNVLVEMAGLPGSGKSTLHQELRRRLVDRGLDMPPGSLLPDGLPGASSSRITRTARTVGRRLHTATSERRAVSSALRTLATSPRSASEKVQALRFTLVTLETHRLARTSPMAPLCLVDEGILQRSFLLFVERDRVADQGAVEAFLHRCPLPDLVVWVDAAPEIALERLASRDRGLPPRLTGLSHDEALERLAAGDQLIRSGLDVMRASGVAVATVDSTAPLGTQVDLALEEVERVMAAGTGVTGTSSRG